MNGSAGSTACQLHVTCVVQKSNIKRVFHGKGSYAKSMYSVWKKNTQPTENHTRTE